MMSTTFNSLSYFSCVTTGQLPQSPCKGICVLVLRRNKRGCGASVSITNAKTEGASHSQNGRSLNLDVKAQEPEQAKVESEPIQVSSVTQPIRAAKIHDFCLGIPFGGLVLTGGLVGSIVSRNPATRNPASLGTGVLIGGGLLGLSVLSLKVWRTGKSSLPFMLGQAGLAAVLMWKNIQTYSMKKVIFPSGFYAAISAAMLCFYTYVVISGGNPPPKKKPTVAIQS